MAAKPMHAAHDATGLVPAPPPGSPKRVLLVLLWLGWIHVNWAVLVALFAALPLPYALIALATYVATDYIYPVREERAEEGGALAAAITRNAEAYHNIRVVYTDRRALESACASGPAVFAYAPHAVLPTGVVAFCYNGSVRRSFHHLPSIANMRVLASSAFMWLPGLHYVWRWAGMSPVDRKDVDRHLSEGRSVLIVPGGVSEALRIRPDCEVLYLRRRFGFVKRAAVNGACVVPVFGFGQRFAYTWWIPFAQTKMLRWISARMHVVPMFFWGRFGSRMIAIGWAATTILALAYSSVAFALLNFLLGLLACYPHPCAMTIVIGAPIQTSDIGPTPTLSQVRKKLDAVVNAMEKLYYDHRGMYGVPQMELRIE